MSSREGIKTFLESSNQKQVLMQICSPNSLFLKVQRKINETVDLDRNGPKHSALILQRSKFSLEKHTTPKIHKLILQAN